MHNDDFFIRERYVRIRISNLRITPHPDFAQIVPLKMKDPAKTKAMADFLKWMLKDGQTSVNALHYVKLPPSVVDEAMQEISRIP
jgi:hypothetical protein